MNAKKKPAGLRAASTKVAVPGALQSAAERRLADTQVRTLIASLVPAQQRLVGALRRQLRERLPTAHEVVYEYRDCIVISYSPSGHGYEGVLGIRASANEVQLFFNRAKELPDPEKLLRGSGSQTRSLDVAAASTLTLPAVARLIDEALARNPVPFASDGSGAVVVRETAASHRRGRRSN